MIIREPKRYKKQPVEIEAIRFYSGDGPNTIKETLKFTGSLFAYFDDDHNVLKIATVEGEMTANDGDWIIKGVAGEFYPCKPDIFEATYEEVLNEN